MNSHAEIMSALLAGKKIRRTDWSEKSFVIMRKNKNFYLHDAAGNSVIYIAGFDVIESKWEEYKQFTLSTVKQGGFVKITSGMDKGMILYCYFDGWAICVNVAVSVPIRLADHDFKDIECEVVANPFAPSISN